MGLSFFTKPLEVSPMIRAIDTLFSGTKNDFISVTSRSNIQYVLQRVEEALFTHGGVGINGQVISTHNGIVFIRGNELDFRGDTLFPFRETRFSQSSGSGIRDFWGKLPAKVGREFDFLAPIESVHTTEYLNPVDSEWIFGKAPKFAETLIDSLLKDRNNALVLTLNPEIKRVA